MMQSQRVFALSEVHECDRSHMKIRIKTLCTFVGHNDRRELWGRSEVKYNCEQKIALQNIGFRNLSLRRTRAVDLNPFSVLFLP
jgi:hypothetical protein